MRAQRAQDLLGSRTARRSRQGVPAAPKTPRQRQIGPVSSNPRSPRRVLPKAVGPGPDPELVKLFDNASGLDECNNGLKIARPELTESERFALLRKHFNDVNIKWLSFDWPQGARKDGRAHPIWPRNRFRRR